MTDSQDNDGHRTKRFKHQSYNEQLKHVHLPTALSRSSIDDDIEDNSSHFHTSLNQWMQLNLSASFLSFARQVSPLSQSLPQLVHHSQEIVELWLKCTENAEDEALRALFDLLQKLVHDLRKTLSSSYDTLLDRLLTFLARSISPAALTGLLTSLSSLLKHLLAPESLTPTWGRFLATLQKCKPEVQRAAAEVWATVLRRLKKDERGLCVRTMLSCSEDAGVDDALAWSFVFSIRSIAQTLHSCASPLTTALLDVHLSNTENVERNEKLIKRVLTALTHHCGKPEHYAVVSDVVIERLVSTQDGDAGALQRTVEIVATLCSVRQGSRLTTKQITRVLETVLKIPITTPFHGPLLKATVACLVSSSSDLAVWLGPGRRAIERAWSTSASFAVCLTGALLDAGWGGFKQFAAPSFTKNAFGVLRDESGNGALQLRTLRVLAKMAKSGHLKTVDSAWKEELATWIIGRLEDFVVSEDSVPFLRETLIICSILPHKAVINELSRLACALVNSDSDPRVSYNSSWANEPWTFGALSRFLASHCNDKNRIDLDIYNLVERVVSKWNWSDHAMAGVAELAKNAQPSSRQLSEETIAVLLTNLKSHSQAIRQGSLEILSSSLVSSAGSRFGEAPRRCLAAETVPLTIQGVRERVLRIGRVGQVIQDGDLTSAQLCASWLLGQLTVSLRPVWSPAAGAVASLADRFPDTVWKLVFKELETVQTSGKLERPDWIPATSNKGEGSGSSTVDGDELNEQERSWRDPSAFKLRGIVKSWVSDDKCRKNIIEDQVARDRFDEGTYEAQLLATLGESPALAEKHSRELVPLFLSFASPNLERKPARTKLVNWLALFSKFNNPKALYLSSEIHSLYTSLLSHPDRPLQSSALSCLLTYKAPALTPHENRLRMLLDDSKWRDEVAMLDIEKVEPAERKELVPTLIRIFFGLMIERGGHGKGSDRRAALLGTMRSFEPTELTLIVDLMLEPFQKHLDLSATDGSSWSARVGMIDVSEKQQAGFLVFLGDVLKNLGAMIVTEWPRLLIAMLSITAQAQHKLDRNADPGEDEEEDEEKLDLTNHTASRQLRTIRQLGLKRLAEFFRSPAQFDFSPYMKEAFRTIISPRLELLDKENTQAPSALLDLFDVWTTQGDNVSLLVQHDSRTLAKIYDCFVAKNVKPAVLTRIFDMVDRLLAHAEHDDKLSETVIKPYMSHLLANLTTLIQNSATKPNASKSALAQREVAVLSCLAAYITDAGQAAALMSLFLPQLRKHHKAVPEKVKTDILKIIANILTVIPNLLSGHEVLFNSAYDTLSQLFQILRGRPARIALTQAFRSLVKADPSLASVADLLSSLNSYSTSRIDEPDFDRRLTSFAKINDELYLTLTAREWLPILHNMLFFVQDDGELSIRSNAALTMKRFLEALSGSTEPGMQDCFTKVLYSGIRHCLLAKSDAVRAEIIGVLSYAVATCGNVIALEEMKPLLANGDEEANIFNNIYHIQLHRRTRALRRLADCCDEVKFRKSTLEDFFVPIVNGFILGVGSTDHHLVNEAVLAIGRISRHLPWGSYNALVNQYLKLCADHATAEKAYTRALVTVLDNFHFPMEEACVEEPTQSAEGEMESETTSTKPKQVSKIHVAVNERLLPNLLKHLEQRDEVEDNIRLPVAAGVAKVALHLPEPARSLQINRLLTVLSQVFRSKSSDTRDLARETLCKIAVSLGPEYLSAVIRQLREALLRGPHLHVLAFVVHATLVHVTSPEHVERFNRLDDCVADIVHVSAEVVFGQSGKDVESEGFKTKIREVRSSSSKALDSFAIISKYMSPTSVGNLLRPIKAIMQETESLKSMQLVDEVLRRISSGINSNPHFGPAELLVFCHTLISQNARFFHQKEKEKPRTSKKRSADDIVVQVKRQQAVEQDHYSHNSWRFVCFGLELFNTAYRRSRFDFQDNKVIARLEPMVTVIGNSLYSTNAQVISSALKVMAQVVKCPLKSIDKSMPVYIKQTMDIIKGAGSTEAETAQVAFKSLSSVIRDCQSAQMKEKDLTFLLELLTPDLEEPSRQSNAFALLRAIIARKFIVAEIYDLMDNVSQIMVTSQSTQVQELCRSALLQFLLDYPQGKGRLNQQITFLVKNLSYVYESGRTSVMELLSACISKFHDNIIEEYAEMLFIALVMVVVNDDATKCREMAAQLIKTLLSRMSEAQRKSVLSHTHMWATQDGNAALGRVSSQVYGLALDALRTDIKTHLPTLLEDVDAKIRSSSHEVDDDGADEGDDDLEWQIPYQALTTLAKVFQVFPEMAVQNEKVSWGDIVKLLLYPHAWVRNAASRLVGTLYSVTTVGPPNHQLDDESPLSLVGMRNVANSSSLQLKSDNLDNALSMQIVKNLVWIGKCFYAIPQTSLHDKDDEERLSAEDSDDETEEEKSKPGHHPLPWLFSKLSYQARSALIARRSRNASKGNWAEQPPAILRWFAAMAMYMNAEHLEHYLMHILAPLYRITDDDTIRDSYIDELKTLALEVQDTLQTKVGTTKFSAVYTRVRQRVQDVRRERRTGRAQQMATNPEAAHKRKIQKNVMKKEGRKRKNKVFAEHKIRNNTLKRRRLSD